MIRAAIFDMGGTLLRFIRPNHGTWRDQEERGIRQLYQYLLEQGYQLPVSIDSFCDALFALLADRWVAATHRQIALHAADWMSAGLAAYQIQLSEAALAEAILAYTQPIRVGVTAVPGAKEALAFIKAQGVQVGLISNTIWPGYLHLEDLELLGLRSYIDQSIFSGDSGVWKPSAAIFQQMLSMLNSSPEETVFIGDNPYEDILGAQAVGLHTIWIRSLEFPLGDVYPDAQIEDQHGLALALQRLGLV